MDGYHFLKERFVQLQAVLLLGPVLVAGAFSPVQLPNNNNIIPTTNSQGSRSIAFSSYLLASKKSSTTFDDTIFGFFEEGHLKISRGHNNDDEEKTLRLYYRIYNKNKNEKKKLPLIVLHGGPSLPSQYLYPMVPNLNNERSIIFYDQLGCGKSDEPKDKRFYSIDQSIEDLKTLLQSLGYDKDSKIHLFGHSYGGCLAYEYAKEQPEQIQSLVLANTPTNMKVAGDSYDRLALKNPLGFWKQRVISVDSPALDDALAHVGNVWAGMDVVLDYVASAPTEPPPRSFPNTLIISCPNDFAYESSRDWKKLLSADNEKVSVEEVSLDTCAHYPHLENGASFGMLLDDFLYRNDTK